MYRISRTVVVLSLAVLISATDGATFTGMHRCDRCGCHKRVNKKPRLICTYEEIEIPVYECESYEVFCPHRRTVCHSGYYCELFYAPRKQGNYTMVCQGKKKRGCKTLLGTKPSWCMKNCKVKKPTGKKRKITVPVPKWVSEYVCEDCEHH